MENINFSNIVIDRLRGNFFLFPFPRNCTALSSHFILTKKGKLKIKIRSY